MRVKWMTLENIHATRTLKQHAYIPVTKKMPYTREDYPGNKVLCSRAFASDDGEVASNWIRLEGEEFDESKACKKCLAFSSKVSTPIV